MILDYKPYMNDTEIVHLLKYIDRNTRMLEIGGGSSTIFFSKFVSRLVTVEHNKEWGTKVWNLLGKRRNNFTIHIAEPDFPQQHPFQPAKPGQFDRYINHIKNLDETFDVILIDGRDRVRSVHASLDKLKKGGYLIIHDFWNRSKYHSVLNIDSITLINEENSFPTGNIVDTLVIFKKK